MKFLIDFEMIGYETEEEALEAAMEYIYKRLNSAASTVRILIDEQDLKKLRSMYIASAGKVGEVE